MTIYLGFLAGVGAVVVYALAFLASRYGVTTNIGEYEITFIRYFVAGIILLPTFIYFRTRHRSVLTMKRSFVLAFFAGIPYMLLIYSGLKVSPASHAAAINMATVPCVVAFITRERNFPSGAFSTASPYVLIFMGLIIFSGLDVLSYNLTILLGDFLFLLSGVFFGVFSVLSKKWGASPQETTANVCVLSLIALPVYLIIFGLKPLQALSVDVILGQALIQGVGTSIIAMLLFTYSLKTLGAKKATLLSPFTPVVTALLAMPLLGEALDITQWIAILVIVAGVILASRKPFKSSARIPHRTPQF